MRRRHLLAGLTGAGVVGGAGIATRTGLLDDREAAVTAHELPAIDAPGSSGGTMTVPEPGRVSFVEVFATWCSICEANMPALAIAHASVDDAVQFVSVTNEPLGHVTTRDDVARWWAEHDGSWPVAHDEELGLSDDLGATGVPHAVVLDERNRPTWEHRGRLSAADVEAAIGDALA